MMFYGVSLVVLLRFHLLISLAFIGSRIWDLGFNSRDMSVILVSATFHAFTHSFVMHVNSVSCSLVFGAFKGLFSLEQLLFTVLPVSASHDSVVGFFDL